jgi:hypothetical protein
MVFAGGIKLAKSVSMDSIGSASLDGMVALMFAGAWWTTRKPSEYRNPWAVAASVICVATGVYIVWAAHIAGRFSPSGGMSVILGVAGLYLYSQGGHAPRHSAPAALSASAEQQPHLVEKPESSC